MDAASWLDGTPSAFVRSIDAPLPLDVLAAAVRAECPYVVWLDSARPNPVTGRYSMLGWDPWLQLTCDGSEVRLQTSRDTVRRTAHPLSALQGVLSRYHIRRTGAEAPVVPGLLACVSYELNGWIERLPAAQPEAASRVPDVWAAGMRQMIVVDHQQQRSWCLSVVDPHESPEPAARQARRRLEALEGMLASLSPSPRPVVAPIAAADLEPLMSQAAFEAMVLRAQDFIAQGEIFQANVSQAFGASWCRSAWPLYLALRSINPSPFACYVQHPDFTVASCSPERLVRVQDGVVATRPIAGTRPRGSTGAQDALNSLDLLLSDKERAEHIMLVDLERNDVGRICRQGTVVVDELMTVEAYSHVMHIVSNVQGRLQPGLGGADVLRAMFPGGTITGCPKVRCMQLLRELEPIRRGLYTGACGWFGFDGALDLNILIRTMVAQHGRLSFHTGAGIVADSKPDREYHETLAKAAALMAAMRAADTVSHDAPLR